MMKTIKALIAASIMTALLSGCVHDEGIECSNINKRCVNGHLYGMADTYAAFRVPYPLFDRRANEPLLIECSVVNGKLVYDTEAMN